MTVLLCALITLFSIPIIQSKDYTGYKLYKIHNTNNVRQFIESFNVLELNGVDIMLINRNVTHALVSPHVQSNFNTLLQQMDATYSIEDNIQSKIDSEKLRRRSGRHGFNEKNFFDDIRPLYEIQSFVSKLVGEHANIAKLKSIGKSYEGNDIEMVILSDSNEPKPKLIFIEAGLHVREWIAPATALYFLKNIVENYGEFSETLRDIEINIVPVANPDGYKFTFAEARLIMANGGETNICKQLPVVMNDLRFTGKLVSLYCLHSDVSAVFWQTIEKFNRIQQTTPWPCLTNTKITVTLPGTSQFALNSRNCIIDENRQSPFPGFV